MTMWTKAFIDLHMLKLKKGILLIYISKWIVINNKLSLKMSLKINFIFS